MLYIKDGEQLMSVIYVIAGSYNKCLFLPWSSIFFACVSRYNNIIIWLTNTGTTKTYYKDFNSTTVVNNQNYHICTVTTDLVSNCYYKYKSTLEPIHITTKK